jgi:hypothetical protein
MFGLQYPAGEGRKAASLCGAGTGDGRRRAGRGRARLSERTAIPGSASECLSALSAGDSLFATRANFHRRYYRLCHIAGTLSSTLLDWAVY